VSAGLFDVPPPATGGVIHAHTEPVCVFCGTDTRTMARHTDPDTSRAGAASVAPRAGSSQKARLLIAYATRGDLTADDAAHHADLLGSCYWKRCGDLRAAGLIEPAGYTRPGRSGDAQMVCRITTLGRQVVSQWT
jgi:hypothetical protein